MRKLLYIIVSTVIFSACVENGKNHAVLDEDWKNLKQLEKQYKLLSERKYRVFDHYEGSYWYYYYYQK